MASNKKLHSAKKEKNNEFCTGLSNIEKAGKVSNPPLTEWACRVKAP